MAPSAGPWWILLQNYAGSTGGDPARLTTTLLADLPASEHMEVAPARPLVKAGMRQGFDLAWQRPMLADDTGGWSLLEATSPSGRSVVQAVQITQLAADVEVSALPKRLTVGDRVVYAASIVPDGTGGSPTHDLTVTLPQGWSVVPGSVSAGGTLTTTGGTTVAWHGTQAALAATPHQPALLSFEAIVGRPAAEGTEVEVITVDGADGGGLSSERTVRHSSTVTGGVYPSTTTVQANRLGSRTGNRTELVATVTGAALATPSGTVTFVDGPRVLDTSDLAGTSTANTGSTARLVDDDLATGRHTLSATYSGDASSSGSTSTEIVLDLRDSRAKVSLRPRAPAKVRSNRKAGALTVRAASGGVPVSGRLTVRINGAGRNLTRTVKLSRTGKASVALGRFPKTGTVRVRINYAGTTAYRPAQARTTFRVRR